MDHVCKGSALMVLIDIRATAMGYGVAPTVVRIFNFFIMSHCNVHINIDIKSALKRRGHNFSLYHCGIVVFEQQACFVLDKFLGIGRK